MLKTISALIIRHSKNILCIPLAKKNWSFQTVPQSEIRKHFPLGTRTVKVSLENFHQAITITPLPVSWKLSMQQIKKVYKCPTVHNVAHVNS